MNQLNWIERVQTSGMRVITGCTRSTPIVALHHLTGLPSIQNRQIEQRAHLVAKAMQNRRHRLHCLVRKALETMSSTPRTPVRHLRNAPLLRPPRRRLNRKSWLDAAITDTMEVYGTHQLATKPCWIPRPEESIDVQVIVEFDRCCCEWPAGAADAACFGAIP